MLNLNVLFPRTSDEFIECLIAENGFKPSAKYVENGVRMKLTAGNKYILDGYILDLRSNLKHRV